jgi:erythromycin esterase
MDLTPVEWLKASAAPFATTEARSGTSDLAPLHPIVGDARIVSLGEATHGSREFFTMKHRVLEFLVEEKGFTIFAIEANLPEADAIDDYVLHGIGDARTALRGIYFWTWNTTEVLYMIEWMREYNLRRGDRPPVRFRGFDPQYAHYAVARVEAYLARVDGARLSEYVSRYDCIRPYRQPQNYIGLSSTTKNACFASIGEALNRFSARRDEYVSRSSVEEYERYHRYATVVVQAESIWSNRGSRDAYMAANVEWLGDVAHPGEKLVLWAHNAHVATHTGSAMGFSLRARYGRDMVVVGFDFDRGGFTSNGPTGLGPQYQPTGPATGWEAFFRQAGLPRFILDLRRPFAPQAAAYVGQFQRMWSIGSLWNPANIEASHRWNVRLDRTFDVMIYVETVTASELLR